MNSTLKNMVVLDDEILNHRQHAVQDVIDLTQRNGKDYLQRLQLFNSRFERNPNNKIVKETNLIHEQ